MITRNAFSLVELLVVLSVISVLAALLLPTLEESLEQSRRLVCQGILKQNALAQTQYASECRGYYPSSARKSHNTTSAYAGGGSERVDEAGWLVAMQYMPYEVAFCPNVYCWSTASPAAFAWVRQNYVNALAASPLSVGMYSTGYYYRFEGSWNNSNTLPAYRNYLHPTKDPKFSKMAITWDGLGGGFSPTTGKLNYYSHANGYNILYGDASVMWLGDPGWARALGVDQFGPSFGTARDSIVWYMLDRK